ncbi:Hsp70 family protein [Dawidia soli]|uniref:Hsp70 family protein n=1 Tax=Dawidia soli TaxID=2782352 RepID=A0AAP2GJ66_9BACT|nr:Hsp70 family protein [Dawidia soli]MBT1687668.1 Hsp70 family protein [Dawidia soli]
MSSTIDFAIDLGTTNSLIAKGQFGAIEVYKNPIGHKETLPSVVGFRNDRILIGDKAREYVEKDPENVFGGFKRKMGTSETFFVKNLQAQRTPIELSALVLKELKTFVHNAPAIPSVVITIPASFDTVQSNATKKAGYEAGFKEVVLLQEPIAACLAFANKTDGVQKQGKWLVYDLGGGTFDVAIVSISDAELTVIDHKGDNYLGGLDFDNLLVERIILKQLFQRPNLTTLQAKAASQAIEFKRLYQILLHKAENAKKELSVSPQTEVEISVEDDAGDTQDIFLTITRADFNSCIEEKALYTIDLIHELLQRNAIANADIQQVVLVGGSTYIPLVRELIERKLNISVNASVDPTTAVVVGAAQYAATKRVEVQADVVAPPKSTGTAARIRVKASYLKTSMDTEELFLATLEGDINNVHYRIQREDGGYDSGLKKATEKIREYLTLLPGQLSRFQVKFFDERNDPVEADIDPIEIVQGKYNIHGQPLPNDICLEVDDLQERTTKLELIFGKNSVLPLKKTIYREVSKTIYKNSKDKLIVSILEGDRFAFPSTNQVIGLIEINPEELNADLVKGSDLEIKLEISESRDINVNVYLSMTEQEFKNVFSPSERYVSIGKLEEEVDILIAKLKSELRQNEASEDYETAGKLDNYLQEAMIIRQGLDNLSTSLNSDEKYHLEERKRKLAQKYDQLGRFRKLTAARIEYFEVKNRLAFELDHSAEARAKYESQYKQAIESEPSFIASESVFLVEAKTKQLRIILNDVLLASTDFLISLYYDLASRSKDEFTDKQKAIGYLEQGEKALERQNYSELKVINLNLLHLLPDKSEYARLKNFKGTGIG